MKTYSPAHTLITLLAMFLSLCFPLETVASGVRVSDDYEIEDFRLLSQDMRSYASSCSDQPMTPSCWKLRLSEFMDRHYAPWKESASASFIEDAAKTMREHCRASWYGENRRKTSTALLRQLLANCDLEHMPSLNRPAIAVCPSAMRVLPTTAPLFKKADDFPFDVLQNAAVKMNDPLSILHVSPDGLWVFARGADASGWIEARDVAFISETRASELMKKDLIVVVKDETLLRDAKNGAIAKVTLGTLLPCVSEEYNSYKVLAAIQAEGRETRLIEARIPKDAARRFPLDFNQDNIALVGNQLLGKPYGWGGLRHNRDCSSMIRDFYLPFGFWLPRGSYNQIHSGNPVSLSKLSNYEKERLLLEKGVPFLTIVYLRGHIMLYVGSLNGRPLVFHASWGVSVKDGEGEIYKHVIGKSIISTLTPGWELRPATGTLLDKLKSFLVLGKCPP
ncbi:MAG: SH3 domain-containing protein [Geobacteraceae bacterium]|nr:SH3 domain-containing protein [Geobacteraceae bacterium]